MPGPLARRAGKSRRPDAAHRRPWQYRDDEGSADARALYGAHDSGCPDPRLWRAPGRIAAERPPGRCRPDHAGSDGDRAAGADDGTFSSGERNVTRSGALLLSLLL